MTTGMRSIGRLLLLGLLFLQAQGVAQAKPLSVFVSIPPQAFIAEQVGGQEVTVHTLVSQGQEPHTFEPAPKQILALSRARLYFTIGLPFEKQIIAKIRQSDNHTLTVVDSSAGITKRPIAGTHGHGAHDEKPDPHVWLSPPLVKIIAHNMLNTLRKVDPQHATIYQRNYTEFVRVLNALQARIQKLLAPFAGQSFYVFHPAFGYFGDTYGLKQKAVETGGKSPTPRQLASLIRDAKADKARIIFVQPQFDRKSAAAMARAINGAVVPMDPLAENLVKNLENMAAEMEQALGRRTKNRPRPDEAGGGKGQK